MKLRFTIRDVLWLALVLELAIWWAADYVKTRSLQSELQLQMEESKIANTNFSKASERIELLESELQLQIEKSKTAETNLSRVLDQNRLLERELMLRPLKNSNFILPHWYRYEPESQPEPGDGNEKSSPSS
jgi:hypothetical protein